MSLPRAEPEILGLQAKMGREERMKSASELATFTFHVNFRANGEGIGRVCRNLMARVALPTGPLMIFVEGAGI